MSLKPTQTPMLGHDVWVGETQGFYKVLACFDDFWCRSFNISSCDCCEHPQVAFQCNYDVYNASILQRKRESKRLDTTWYDLIHRWRWSCGRCEDGNKGTFRCGNFASKAARCFVTFDWRLIHSPLGRSTACISWRPKFGVEKFTFLCASF